MLFKELRNHFWMAAAKNEDVSGLTMWKRLARGDKNFQMTNPDRKTNVDFLGASELDRGALFNMKCELSRAVVKGSSERIDFIADTYPEAFVGYSSPGYEDDEHGQMTMTATEFNRVKDLVKSAISHKQEHVVPKLESLSSKIDKIIAKPPTR